jgi:hypothetical protein
MCALRRNSLIVMGNKGPLFLVGFESDALYQHVYLSLNGIIIDVNATPNPCAAGSETVCPVVAGDVNQYSAVVKLSAELPPVRQNVTV